jgi:hypothetical protein
MPAEASMIVLTYHAVEQFISRCRVQMTNEAAWEYLEQQLPHANHLRERSVKGDSLWELPNGFFLITRKGTNGVDVAVTVLKELSTPKSAGPTEEELEMLFDSIVSPAESPRTGRLTVRVEIQYELNADNGPIAEERILQSLRTSLGAVKERRFAKAVVTNISATALESTYGKRRTP